MPMVNHVTKTAIRWLWVGTATATRVTTVLETPTTIQKTPTKGVITTETSIELETVETRIWVETRTISMEMETGPQGTKQLF